MGIYRFADRIFELRNKYAYTEQLCADYACGGTPDFIIEFDDTEIEAERRDDGDFSLGYLESLAFYRRIAELLMKDGCILMHGAAIEYDGKAYIFTAKSGTGKTTHISLWKKAFGDKVTIINGDKPLLRVKRQDENAVFTVYGTPWCGKEGKNTDTSATLGGICLLRRSENNTVKPAENEKIVPFLLGQMFFGSKETDVAYLLETLDLLIKNIPIYSLGCNMEEEAAFKARKALVCGETEK